MSKSTTVRSRGGAQKRKDVQYVSPFSVVIIGVDTDAKSKADHPRWDPRIALPVNEKMARSILTRGVLKPVTVTRVGNDSVIVDGIQRTRACRRACAIAALEGLDEPLLPTFATAGNDAELLAKARTANGFAVLDKPMAKAVDAQLMLDKGFDLAKVAEVFGEDERTIKLWVEILGTSPKVQTAIDSGRLSVSAASKLAKLPREKQEAALAKQLAAAPPDKRVTVRAASNAAREAEGKAPTFTARQRIDQALEQLDALRDGAASSPAAELDALERVVSLVVNPLRAALVEGGDKPTAHYAGCWKKPGHHQCAIGLLTKVEALRDEWLAANDIEVVDQLVEVFR